jgi:AbrB family looped-hinge helix DNA binding protein
LTGFRARNIFAGLEPEPQLTTTVTEKGQVTLPKKVREAAGIKPGDKVDVRSTASGTVVIEPHKAMSDYERQLRALAKRRLIRGITTEEFMEMTRGEVEARPRKKR